MEETAIGANEASREYMELLENGQMKNIIVTACASVVMMVERHYPDLIKCLAPVSSPMMAHAKLMRELYGDIKVVFIGPCLSKMNECDDPLSGGMVNYALTFADVERWLGGEPVSYTHLIIESMPKEAGVSTGFHFCPKRNSFHPISLMAGIPFRKRKRQMQSTATTERMAQKRKTPPMHFSLSPPAWLRFFILDYSTSLHFVAVPV